MGVGGEGGGEGNGGGVKKSFSALLRASVWSKNNLRRVGGGGQFHSKIFKVFIDSLSVAE